MSFLFGGLFREKHAPQDQRKEGTPFTPAFYRFLLGFSLILALSFATLVFLGFNSEDNLTASNAPGCDTTETGTDPTTEHC